MSEVHSGRTNDEIKHVQCDLHEKLMRAVDDIKESVRRARWCVACGLFVINRLRRHPRARNSSG